MLLRAVSILILGSIVLFSNTTKADRRNGNISQLFCKMSNATGSLSITFTAFGYFNVTRTNAFGFPISTEQAKLFDSEKNGEALTFMMQGVFSRTRYELTLFQGTNEGEVVIGNKTIPMNCTSKIDIM